MSINLDIKAVETRVNKVDLKATKNRAAIAASKGTLDIAYPPLMLATGARSMGLEASVFFYPVRS